MLTALLFLGQLLTLIVLAIGPAVAVLTICIGSTKRYSRPQKVAFWVLSALVMLAGWYFSIFLAFTWDAAGMNANAYFG